MPSTPFRLGFIGGALDSAVGYAHSVACKMDNRWALDAGCFSLDAKFNREAANEYGVSPARVYDRWRDLLQNEKQSLDAVVILTPTPSHFDIIISCLRAGFPVICEKAMVVSSAEAREILDVCNQEKGFLAVTYNYSGYPMVRELRNLIRKGVLGKLLHFQVEMPQEGFKRVDSEGKKPVPQAWRLADRDVPTIYLDLGVHLHHLIHYLTEQRPLAVIADQASYGWFNVIDNVMALCRYSENIQGQVWFSKSALGHRNGLRLRLYGSEASAEWFQCNPEELALSYSDGRRQIMDRASEVDVTCLRRYNRFKAGHPAGFIEAFANLYSDVAICLQQYKTSGTWTPDEVYSAELAEEGLRMLESMVLSSKTGSWQKV